VTPTPDAPFPVHAAQMSIDSTSILRNMTSGSQISACAAPSPANRTGAVRPAGGRVTELTDRHRDGLQLTTERG
jgi:hypothetical protein